MNWSQTDEKLKFALCALSFFRARHKKKPRFKSSKRTEMVSTYKDNARMARIFIDRARRTGWRGSIVEAIKEKGDWAR